MSATTTVDFPLDYLEQMAGAEESSFWFRGRNQLIVSMLGRWFPSARSLLDVGCGTGFVLDGIARRLPQLELAGVDPLAAAVELTRRRVRKAEVAVGDARTLAYGDGAFDVVGCFDVLEHLDDDAAALRELARVARLGVVVTVPQHRWLWSSFDAAQGHKRRYTRRELVAKIVDSDLELAFVSSVFMSTLPAVALRRRLPGKENLRTQMTLPAAVDAMLMALTRGELRLLGTGLRLPFGSSLVAVARKRAT